MQRGSVLVHYENAVILTRRKYFYSTRNCNIDACMHGSRSYICNIFPILQTSGLINNFHQHNQNFIHKPGKFFCGEKAAMKTKWRRYRMLFEHFFDLMISV